MEDMDADNHLNLPSIEPDSMPPTSTVDVQMQLQHTPVADEAVDHSTAKQKRRPPKPRSEVWYHFTKFMDENGDQKAKCNYCNNVFQANSKRNGATSLKLHMGSCKKRVGGHNSQSELQFRSDGDGLTTWKFNQESTRNALAKMIVMDELPFRFVESKGFNNFLSVICPRFKVPSRWTIGRDIYELYVEEKKKLKLFLKSNCNRVCLTTDCWTSLQRVNYLCLTAHFVDNEWKLQKRILNFCPISSHRGDDIGKVVDKCLRDWGIQKVFIITVDNASSNDVAINFLKRKWSNVDACMLGGKFLHMRCIAHILNLIVCDGLKDFKPYVARVRRAVKYIRQSPARLAKFRECALAEKVETKGLLCLDVNTRWNSTYLMLDVAQKYEKAFEAYEEVDLLFKTDLLLGDGLLERDDWEKVRKLCILFKKFYDLTLKISGSHYATSNLFLDDICDVYSTLLAWQNDFEIELRVMSNKMKDKYDKYWGNVEKMNVLLYVASILDPRKKLEYVRYCLFEMYPEQVATVIYANVRKAIDELFDEYAKVLQPQCSQGSQVTAEVRVSVDAGIGTSTEGPFFSKYKKFRRESEMEENKSELEKYLAEDDEKDEEDFDVLQWWKNNSLRYPVLSSFARDLLAVPISTVASESAFSTGGRVLDAYRSSLTSKIVQALICSQDWLRGASVIAAIEDDLIELEKLDSDLSKIALDTVLET